MADTPSSRQRWHDQQPTVARSVKLLEIFPPDCQILLGETIITLAEKHCKAKELMANLRSLGPEKVLSIFKSKGKRRPYDQLPTVHQALNYMFILPDNERLYIAGHVIVLVDHMVAYFKYSMEHGSPVYLSTVAALTNSYAQGQFKDLNSFLAQLQQSAEIPAGTPIETSQLATFTAVLADELAAPEPVAKTGGERDTKIAHDNTDMKIKLDL